MKAILPKIKFKNFYEKWNRKKLQSIAPLRGGFAFKSEKFQNSGIPIVRISNIKFDGTVGGEFEYYSKINSDEKFVLRGRSILLAMSGATTGKIAMLDSEEEYYQNQRVGYFQNTGAVNYDFLSSVLQTKEFTNQLNSVLVAGAQPNISSKEIDSFIFCIPESLNEQSAIGSLFRTLDDLLASYKENLANYQSLKATMLSKMFPKAGHTVPEIRLDGFEDEWDLIKLGDFCDLITKGTTGKSQSEQGMVNFVKVENLKDNEIYPIVKISEEEHFGSLKRSILYEGDILFSIAGTLGRTAIVKNNILPANTNQALAIIRGYKLDAYFLLVVLSGEVVKDYIRKNPTVGAQPNLSLEQVSSLKIKIPSLDEQQAIGSYFSNLDNLITFHQEKITQLETLKKKLLQDMFI